MNRNIAKLGIVTLTLLTLYAPAGADIITFDAQGITGPSTFAAATPQTVNTVSPDGVGVSFSGGTILTNTTNLPADQTSIYGTAGFATPQGSGGYQNQITVNFPQAEQNIVARLLNGSTIPAIFQVTDNVGDSALFTIPPNLSSGMAEISLAGFASQFTVTQLTNDPNVSGYDFFLDNIQFNVPVAGVPDGGSTALLLLAGCICLLVVRGCMSPHGETA